MATLTLSFRTEEKTRDELDKLAEVLDRNRNWLINEAIDAYLGLHRAQIEEIRKGEADIAAGRWFTTDQIRAQLSTLEASTKEERKRTTAQFKANRRRKNEVA